ncbi:ferredoxin [Nocardia inohanensis]|uniref:ferredoxin n=1 Tax=Nocardia inohanensis TaxID=209246 RepID=UPI00082A2A73|nr:ferredoxin [Nocardia inohanensis]
MKIAVDTAKCAGLGVCESLAPDYFEVGPQGSAVALRPDVPEADEHTVQDAIAACPTQALRSTR